MEQVREGFRRTEFGIIPNDWEYIKFGELISELKGGAPLTPKDFSSVGMPVLPKSGVTRGGQLRIEPSKQQYCTEEFANSNKSSWVDKTYTIIVLRDLVPTGPNIGLMVSIQNENKYILAQGVYGVKFFDEIAVPDFLIHLSNTGEYRKLMKSILVGSTQVHIRNTTLKETKVPLPKNTAEQKAIATALSDVDELITKLEKLIEKKKAIKQGAMQQLLTPPHKGGKRLEGFSGEWNFLSLMQVADCLDNIRLPLNGEQRLKRTGDIPYCGANGIVDFVNDYIVDDDIILMAEDGGYFDEYKTRPIAYRMTGKCWVNNHAHILKAKSDIDQGFLFYSLVHKNILDYINGGTRAKLNKGEMYKIECWFPNSKKEQEAISAILSDMDAEIKQIEAEKEKYQNIKQGMMQELLTGKTRLI